MSVTVFGVRHHGPGSARSLGRALHELAPDAVLIEGPPEADEIVAFAADEAMRPPVALLTYAPDEPRKAVFHPFAAFSPEWQAIRYALGHSLPLRFIDLPVANWIGGSDRPPASESDPVRSDPLGALAEAAGHGDPERWWEDVVEHRRDQQAAFEAIAEAMTALREGAEPESEHEARREAHMRSAIRRALADQFERIAVVCGAWHVPALQELPGRASDDALLKGLPKTKVASTWVPWTYDRLSYTSGYGAGVVSPGWYHHLFTADDRIVIRWLAKTARMLREEDVELSSAHVLEATRTAEALAALRGRPLAGLPEILDATAAVVGTGADAALALIQRRLIVGELLGEVGQGTPVVPLQADVSAEQRRLRLKPEAATRQVDLDLRKDNDRARSHLLHRLALLAVPWGELVETTGAKGTFHELWNLRWEPEFAVRLIEASMWGTTLPAAATAHVRNAVEEATQLAELTGLVEATLFADLTDATADVMRAFEARAAVGADAGALMDALPPLARVLRYGNVRETDVAAVSTVVDGLVARICIGLGGAASALDDDASAEIAGRITATNGALALLDRDDLRRSWWAAVTRLAARDNVHGLVAGRAARLLMDVGELTAEDAAHRLSRALSRGADAAHAAAWIEGLLAGGGTVLVHHNALLGILDGWVAAVGDDDFTGSLAVLRRTFSTFTPAERRQIGERVRRGERTSAASENDDELDHDRAALVLPVLAQILGVEHV